MKDVIIKDVIIKDVIIKDVIIKDEIINDEIINDKIIKMIKPSIWCNLTIEQVLNFNKKLKKETLYCENCLKYNILCFINDHPEIIHFFNAYPLKKKDNLEEYYDY